MALSDIAAGLTVTTRQRERGVATADDTDRGLAARLASHDGALPCGPDAAGTLAEAYAGGAGIDESAAAAGLAPTQAASTLHRLGFAGLSPLSPMGRELLGDWLDGHLSRAEALELSGASERAFALATYIETHDPIPGARDAVESALAADVVGGPDPLAEAVPDPEPR